MPQRATVGAGSVRFARPLCGQISGLLSSCAMILGVLDTPDTYSEWWYSQHIVALPPDFRSIRLTHRKREFYCVNKTLPVCHGRLETITC